MADVRVLKREIAEILAARHGFRTFTDVAPAELMVIIMKDSDAIVRHLVAEDYLNG